MVTEVTDGVKVSVATQYEEEASAPLRQEYLFSYHITIENQNPFAIRLLRRHWEIEDSLSFRRIVDGEGVVGEQPVLMPGESYTYTSACNLRSDMGSMQGNYLFTRLDLDEQFRVNIPKFMLISPEKLN